MSTLTTGSQMAKKKPSASGQKAILVKGSPEWHAWFTKLAEFSRMPGVVLVDRALAEWAQRNNFPDPPPKR